MDTGRFVLTDRQWQGIKPLCPGNTTAAVRTGNHTQRFFEAFLWILRTDAPWRDLPHEFGNWNRTVRRLHRVVLMPANRYDTVGLRR